MLLSRIIKLVGIPKKDILGQGLSRNVKYASSDSRLVFPESIFLVKKGQRYNAFDFIPEIKDKVVCFVVSKKENKRVQRLSREYPGKVFLLVDDIDRFADKLSKVLFKGYKRLKIIGITGTNGKTTTAYIIGKILNDLELESGLLGTVKYSWKKNIVPSFMTTLDNFMFKSLLCKLNDDGLKYVVSEVSSHGLATGRVKDIFFQRAVFTNLSQDHLDFHRNMQAYLKAKKKIFNQLTGRGKAVVNIDNKYGKKIYEDLKIPKLSFSLVKDSDYKARGYRFTKKGLEFLIDINKKSYLVKAPMVGVFNVYNVLAAFVCALSLGLDIDRVIKSISSCDPPPGRMERFGDNVFVDYAHTPEALKQSIEAIRASNFKKVIVVFGCGGQRDKGKRSKMGKIVSKYADYGIITSDNPRKEDPYKICKDIEKGIAKDNYTVVIDRTEAIEKGIKLAKHDVAVLVAGKGHEDYQVFADHKVRFSDREFIKKLLG